MSATKAVYDMLKSNAALTAVVPVAKIYAGLIPVNAVLPAIAYNQISSVRPKDIAMVTRMVTSRVQVTVMTKGYPQQKAIIDLVRVACDAKQGTFNSVVVDSCVVDVEGPDLRDDDAGIFMQTIDFIVKFLD
jgi:hydroxymethylpyrimidine/phosphomethylpyrimidine kinase